MPVYDYLCPNDHAHEHSCKIVERVDTRECPECGEIAKFQFGAPAIVTHIVVDYPGSKKHKAGYQHTHGDRRGTKIQTGYGGKITPSDEPKGSPDGAIWKNPLA
jgi:predicted nucleic acid-binding Zn ribbon protein